ncbi:dihydroxyacetone kinase transcriptional activator DhaS [Alkalibacterium sp. f15]|uniref:dihydroxyacetone kinase transcriptional activator DhaS n=1 Tax=Alkalibacterium sp. f15 TaxID=3414029 RepID=UPI003BF8E5D7
MDQSIITKKVIAYSFKTLMQKEPFAKISVSDIMKKADLRRQTFYYHFQDKYELIEWIYHTESQENISDLLDFEHWDSILKQIFVYFNREQKFYKNALAVYEQNGFSNSLYVNLRELFLKILNDDHVPCERFTDEKKNLVSSFLGHGMVGIIKDWIQSGCKVSPEKMAYNVYTYLLDICGTRSEA